MRGLGKTEDARKSISKCIDSSFNNISESGICVKERAIMVESDKHED